MASTRLFVWGLIWVGGLFLLFVSSPVANVYPEDQAQRQENS